MNAIERKKQEYHAKIRELGSRIRVQGLDKDNDTPEHNARAEALISSHSEEDVKEALGFAGYLEFMADPDCADCRGLGAVIIVKCSCDGKMVNGSFWHSKECKDGLAADTFDPCECARRNEKKRKAERPAFVVKKSRDETLDRRIAEAEKEMTAALKRQSDAVAPIKKEISAAESGLDGYRAKRQELSKAVEFAEQEELSTTEGIKELRERLRDAEMRLQKQREAKDQCVSVLNTHDAESAGPKEALSLLEQKCRRVSGHHTPKIEKARKKLRRLKFLRGDAPGPDEVQVTFSSTSE